MPRRCAPGPGRRWATTTTTSSTAARRRIILAALVTPADVMENVPLRDLLWRVCFRRKLRPAPGDRRHHLRHGREHRRRSRTPASGPTSRCPISTTGRRSSVRDAFTYDAAADGYRCPQATVAAASASTSTPSEAVVYRRRAADLQRLSAQGPVHRQRPRPDRAPVLLRGVSRAGARLPRDRGLPEGDAQAAGVGRAALRRGQGLARVTAAPAHGAWRT